MDQEKGFRDLKLRSLGKGHFFLFSVAFPPLSVGLLDFSSFDHKKIAS